MKLCVVLCYVLLLFFLWIVIRLGVWCVVSMGGNVSVCVSGLGVKFVLVVVCCGVSYVSFGNMFYVVLFCCVVVYVGYCVCVS